MNNYEYLFKFIVIGDTGVGKSCIVLQFIEGKMRLTHDVTIGVEFGAKLLRIDGKDIKLQIWDTAGQQNFRSITRSYYRSAIGALLVFDITRRETFDHLRNWLEEVNQNGNPYMQIILVGNKTDMEESRKVSRAEASEFAKSNGLEYLEVSAKTSTGVEDAFVIPTQGIYSKILAGKIPLGQESIGIKVGEQSKKQPTLGERPKPKGSSCC